MGKLFFIINLLMFTSLITACSDEVDFQSSLSKVSQSVEDIDPSTLPPEEPGGGGGQQPPNIEPPIVVNPRPPGEQQLLETEEVFQQKLITNAVDILIVEDTTLSMHNDRWTLHQKFDHSISNLGNLDWQMALTSTDLGKNRLDGSLIKFDNHGTTILSSISKNALDKFTNKIGFDHCNENDFVLGWGDLGCSLDGHHILGASVKAIEKNRNIFRPKANLAVVYITDEDEAAKGKDYQTTPNDVISAVRTYLGEVDFKAYGVIIQPGDSACLEQQKLPFVDPGAKYASVIEQLIQQTGGDSVSICNNDYSELFRHIQGNAAGELQTNFILMNANPLDAVVQLEPPQAIDYKIDGNILMFNSPPASGTKISIKYKHERN
ncbi:MAG: hypothetical protein KDD58_05010 [Bdellovibrionales bacterium]|nr:hypothetical protein [Bdellovibrionales bacterium]